MPNRNGIEPNHNDLCSVELLSSFFKKHELGSARHFCLKSEKARPKLELGLGLGSDTVLVITNHYHPWLLDGSKDLLDCWTHNSVLSLTGG